MTKRTTLDTRRLQSGSDITGCAQWWISAAVFFVNIDREKLNQE